ncbi:MAG TPA: hypothetical protein VFT62_00225 [Mycobacteriales bacterium]|nr:hypothetical protein [Mycobacteriales bacterium]
MSNHDPATAAETQTDTDDRQERDPQQPPGLANAQVTGGGGHVPPLDDNGPDDSRARVPAAGSGVDMKSDHLGDAADD